jgi:hypothetical protein
MINKVSFSIAKEAKTEFNIILSDFTLEIDLNGLRTLKALSEFKFDEFPN